MQLSSLLLALGLSPATGTSAAAIGVAQFFDSNGACNSQSLTSTLTIQDVVDICQVISDPGIKTRVRILDLTLPAGYHLRAYNPADTATRFNYVTVTQNGTSKCFNAGTTGSSFIGVKLYNQQNDPVAC